MPLPPAGQRDLTRLVDDEWLVTNGLGGYASGTVGGVITRRYHGLLVAALPNPLGRRMMLNHVIEELRTADGRTHGLGGEELAAGELRVPSADLLADFRLEAGLPVWTFQVSDIALEKRVWMPHRQNTVHVSYTLTSGSAAVLSLRPAVHFRSYEAPVTLSLEEGYRFIVAENHFIISLGDEHPELRLLIHGDHSTFRMDELRTAELIYRVEASRGYDRVGALWSPGVIEAELQPGETLVLVASTEPYEIMTALTPAGAQRAEIERRRRLLAAAPVALQEGIAAELVLAADQFVITPAGRLADAARARAFGDEIRTIIAGYHWFTDWGRDTMISLEGLTLTSGRYREAGSILRTFAHYVRDGLIPNLFPDGSDEGLYHTADATLWFFQALHRYVEVTDDRALLGLLLPTLLDIVAHHRAGTRFGIGMDPEDGLLRQGAPGYQLTWMDAKVDDWVVTPRRGKAVEINALWYNALCLLAGWLAAERSDAEARPIAALAAQVHRSFNDRFWYADGGYCYDVVDGPEGDSTELRPNQIFAISLPHPVLQERRWAPVVEVVKQRLLTPVGLRSLAPGSAAYKARYFGDLRARDAAYHQGTVWAWLIGPFIDAWLRVHPGDLAGARGFLEGLPKDLGEYGIGTVAEIFDADPPYTPRGCIAQAWSVAEMLRCWALVQGAGAGA
ncbi:MAG TPA: amylo-alpha-1,6-glucosidase [Gemmatimonadales bacterium]|nr:amylo-alpha-1,6-glucosidase [Gemmatimonadales bacterium]